MSRSSPTIVLLFIGGTLSALGFDAVQNHRGRDRSSFGSTTQPTSGYGSPNYHHSWTSWFSSDNYHHTSSSGSHSSSMHSSTSRGGFGSHGSSGG